MLCWRVPGRWTCACERSGSRWRGRQGRTRSKSPACYGSRCVRPPILYGDIVRVLTKADDPEPIRAWLAAAGITAEVTPVAVDMETAFAFLAELGAAA